MGVSIERIKCNDPEGEADKFRKAEGYKSCLGSGLYARVYAKKGSDAVLKVGDVDRNDAYLSYVKAILRTKKQSAFLPQIIWVKIFRDPRTREPGVMIVKMEKLKAVRDSKEVEATIEALDNYFEHWSSRDTMFKSYKLLGVEVTVPKDLRTAFSVLDSAQRSNDHTWDWHSGNIMLRGKQLVFTDPLHR